MNRQRKVAKCPLNEVGKTRCPCKHCQISMSQSLDRIECHLFMNGMSPSYTQWVYHGEPANLARFQTNISSSIDDRVSREFNVEHDDDEMFGLLNDLQGSMIKGEGDVDDEEDFKDGMPTNTEERDNSNIFEELIAEARNQFYPGCAKFSLLNFLVRLMHIKVLNDWSNKSFNMLLNLLKDAFPTGASIPVTFYEAKRKLRDLGLGYDPRLQI
ncbi:uncharacterized protein LOC120080309 [Benincasa hispida]|uniref:uncharacterized protein LOC120080309 n=1 Tax=Benincasa hispida TaxID=102211 RepID=UPI0018FFCC77|nr:uncharacterized protein LOC120080309 [Benincasa hispida]